MIKISGGNYGYFRNFIRLLAIIYLAFNFFACDAHAFKIGYLELDDSLKRIRTVTIPEVAFKDSTITHDIEKWVIKPIKKKTGEENLILTLVPFFDNIKDANMYGIIPHI